MMAYATVNDVQERMTRNLTADEQTVCASLLDDAAAIIDAYNSEASEFAKYVVSCRMVIRVGSILSDHLYPGFAIICPLSCIFSP